MTLTAKASIYSWGRGGLSDGGLIREAEGVEMGVLFKTLCKLNAGHSFSSEISPSFN